MKQAAALTLTVALLVVGCGRGRHADAPGSAPTSASPSPSGTPAALRAAVRAAVEQDHRTSVAVLWTNRVPARPPATAGPALTQLRRAAAGRRARGIRVRLLRERFRVLSTNLDPSYTTANAEVADVQRLQPARASGKPIGHTVRLAERARLELHRIPHSHRFVVWNVVLAK
jgi:hypothetical protein